MSTFVQKPAEVEKKWILIDAEGLVVGRLASIIANRLRGKHKRTFTPHVDDALKKRIRLANALSLLGVGVLLASIPFDYVTAPRWMLIEDIGGMFAFVALPFLAGAGHPLLSRVLCLLIANLIVFGNVVLLGPESGISMVFIAFCAVPFALFDLRERAFLEHEHSVGEADLRRVRSERDLLGPVLTGPSDRRTEARRHVLVGHKVRDAGAQSELAGRRQPGDRRTVGIGPDVRSGRHPELTEVLVD